MIRNYKEEYNNARRIAKDVVKTADNPQDITLYLSFTKYGKSIYKKMNKQLHEDTLLDYELGVIDESEMKISETVYHILENSIAGGKVY